MYTIYKGVVEHGTRDTGRRRLRLESARDFLSDSQDISNYTGPALSR